MNISSRNLALVSLLFISTGLFGCASAAPTQTPIPVTVQLTWTHQAQFAGFYTADQNGYYGESIIERFAD